MSGSTLLPWIFGHLHLIRHSDHCGLLGRVSDFRIVTRHRLKIVGLVRLFEVKNIAASD
jgi:hypothetical protein